MQSDSKAEQLQQVAEGARKQLAEGTWPQVVIVLTYPSPLTPRTPVEGFARLKLLFEQAGLQNIAAFVDFVQFEEAEHGVGVSYSIGLRPRDIPGKLDTDIASALLTRTILIGSRGGTQGAVSWLTQLSEQHQKMVPELVQVTDKILGEAITCLANTPRQKIAITELIQAVLRGSELPLHSSKSPEKQ